MSYAEIAHWLKGTRNYSAGIELLQEHGGSATMLTLLRSGENEFTRSKLARALQQIYDEQSAADIPQVAQTKKTPGKYITAPEDYERHSENKKMWIDYNGLTDGLKKLWIKKADLSREQGRLHAQLLLLPKKEARLEAALRILDIEDERAAIWRTLERWQRDKIDETALPDKPAPGAVRRGIELVRKHANVMAQISKYKKRGDAAKLAALQEEKQRLENLINEA